MSNMIVTNNNTGVLVIADAYYQDDTFTAGGAGTTAAGTILARNAGGKLVPFVKGAGDETGVPVSILTVELVAAGAGDLPVRPLISGSVHKNDLIIAADGDDSNIDAAVKDALKVADIIALESVELNILDNQ